MNKRSASMARAYEAATRYQKVKEQNFLKRVNHILSWAVDIVFALIPIMSCKINSFLHSDNGTMINNYNKFRFDFFSSGSFLWTSVTILVMSLLELLLYGFKKDLTVKARVLCNCFLVVSALFVLYAVFIYLDNIGSPVDARTMNIISWVTFALFSISSGIILLAIVKEV